MAASGNHRYVMTAAGMKNVAKQRKKKAWRKKNRRGSKAAAWRHHRKRGIGMAAAAKQHLSMAAACSKISGMA